MEIYRNLFCIVIPFFIVVLLNMRNILSYLKFLSPIKKKALLNSIVVLYAKNMGTSDLDVPVLIPIKQLLMKESNFLL